MDVHGFAVLSVGKRYILLSQVREVYTSFARASAKMGHGVDGAGKLNMMSL